MSAGRVNRSRSWRKACLTAVLALLASSDAIRAADFGLRRGERIPFLKWTTSDGTVSTFGLRGSRYLLLLSEEVCERCDAIVREAVGTRDPSLLVRKVVIIEDDGQRRSSALREGEGLLLPRDATELALGGNVCKPPLPYVALVNEHGEIEMSNAPPDDGFKTE